MQAERRELQGQRLGEPLLRELGRAVDGNAERAIRPPTEPMVTTRPRPAARMDGSTAWVTAMVPKTLASKTARTSASERSSRQPRRPDAAVVDQSEDAARLGRGSAATAASMLAWSVRSSRSTRKSTPRSRQLPARTSSRHAEVAHRRVDGEALLGEADRRLETKPGRAAGDQDGVAGRRRGRLGSGVGRAGTRRFMQLLVSVTSAASCVPMSGTAAGWRRQRDLAAWTCSEQRGDDLGGDQLGLLQRPEVPPLRAGQDHRAARWAGAREVFVRRR